MKTKNSIQITLWAALLLVPALSIAQNRDVDWIHGLGGNQNSWDNVHTTYTGQNLQISSSTRLGYVTNSGIAPMASAINNAVSGGSNTISISHSMGGTAVRQLDLWNSNKWAGNLTVGSPLRGAKIAPATQNGDAQSYISHGTTELLRGPASGSQIIFLINPTIGIAFQIFATIGVKNSNSIAGALVDAITGSYGLTGATASDLDPNGSYMQNIASQSTGTPKIHVWGNEDDPVVWRVASSYADNGNDQTGVNVVNDAAGIYQAESNIANTMSWIPPFILFAHAFLQWRSRCWQAGADWLRTESNDAWKVLIGAGNSYTQTVWVPELDWQCYEQNQQCDPENPNSCDQNECMNYVQQQVTTYYVDNSDGVVPAFSARNDGGAWRGHTVEAPGVNHREMLAFDRIHFTLDDIFDGANTGSQSIFTIGH